ncbi:cytochrome P450 [Dokdonia sp. Dokd-P16]|uniref:cytochrome P450 n=1 Tax=Dokdonia sp. Dokd-P16 TaxID=2173169 RepID=UPI000D54448E|nr:cytochrome P450 [Dokdonia sp. Dokd-P16]AWH73371.1 cytochrome P450 [Dokdonia sp. Dokd-P16]
MPDKIPAVSVFKFLANAGSILKNPLPFHKENFELKGDTFKLKLGFGNDVVFSRDPEFARYALQKNQRNYSKSPIQTKDLAKYVGEGLLTAEGDHWKKQRKLIQPAFHKKQLAQLLDVMHEVIQKELLRIVMHKPFDVFEVFNDLAFMTVVKALFKTDVDRDKINRLQHITEQAQKMLVKELRQPFKAWYFKYGGPIDKHLALTKEARVILKELVQERKDSGDKPGDLLDMLLDSQYEDGGFMDDKQLIDEILILFSAGHETTSNALTFTAELLARNPIWQDKIYKEYAFAKANSISLNEFLRHCTITKQVLEETMRMYPPAYFIDRVNIEDDDHNGMEVPAGSNLLFSVIEIHKHKDFWERADQFDPTRFDDNAGMKHPAYFPFGAGPRMCIGNNFAMYEMILAITEMVSMYKITPKNTPIEILPLITLKPKNALLEFIPR